MERYEANRAVMCDYRIPAAVSNAGHIAVFVPCQCFIGFDEEEYDGAYSAGV